MIEISNKGFNQPVMLKRVSKNFIYLILISVGHLY